MSTAQQFALTEYREKEIIRDLDTLSEAIKTRKVMDISDKIKFGQECNEVKAGLEKDGRSWPDWRDANIKEVADKEELIRWMRAAEAFDNPDIIKTGHENINDLYKLYMANKPTKRPRVSKIQAVAEVKKAAEEDKAKAVEEARAKAQAESMEFAKATIAAAAAPKQITCPHCGTQFTH